MSSQPAQNLLIIAVSYSPADCASFQLFIRSPNAGEQTAGICSMLLTCEIRGVDPIPWLRDVLTKVPKIPRKQELIKLLPYNWQE
tara:strand:+ start:106 stop:360 length:255 start_codon:yes stop_codon:yes gene_type:complete